MRLFRIAEPFDHPDWLFELKYDGFRALAHVERRQARLVSRNGHTFRAYDSLCDCLGQNVNCDSAVLDGEIVCLDADGRPHFNRLLHRREEPYFYAFDLLWLDGRDLRTVPLVERKRALRALIPPQPSHLMYADHVTERGVALFEMACKQDLEGIVAKLADGPYQSGDVTTWIKIKNPNYTQAVGRPEQFSKRRTRSASTPKRRLTLAVRPV